MQQDPLSLENKVIYLLTTQPLTFNAKQELERLFDVFAFAKTLYGQIRYPHAKSITCKDCHSYKALYNKLVTFIKQEEEEGDFWFDRTEALGPGWRSIWIIGMSEKRLPYYRNLTLHEINVNLKICVNLSRVNLC